MSCILKAALPNPVASKKRLTPGAATRAFHCVLKSGVAASGAQPPIRRGSCFQLANKFSAIVNTAEPWTTCTRRVLLKLSSSRPNNNPLTNIPTSSMTYINATTRGRVFSSAKSVARASPAVWVICNPAPTNKNAKAPKV